MKSTIQKIASLLFCILVFVGCSDTQTDDPNLAAAGGSNRLQRMSPEEREKLAPNELFQAIFEEDFDKVKVIVRNSPRLLEEQNVTDKDLPLGIAIKLRNRDIAVFLANETPQSYFSTPNSKNESLFFLASQHGMHEVISRIGTRFFDKNWHVANVLYSIDSIDYPDSLGRKALHVAANRQVVEALEIEHQKGYLKIPYFFFFLHTDKDGANFFHSAAKAGRIDILLFGSEKFCGEGWAESPDWWVNIPGTIGNVGWRLIQFYTPWNLDSGLRLEQPLNVQDNNGRTPLHEAASRLRIDAIRAIGNCPYTDYDAADKNGNRAFHIFMQNLDTRQPQLSQNERDILQFFINHETRMLKPWVWKEKYVNAVNLEDESPLHFAALLADPWFYNELKNNGGDIYLKNKRGQRPVDLFNHRQAPVR